MRVIEPDYELVFVHDKTTVDKQTAIIEHNLKKEPILKVEAQLNLASQTFPGPVNFTKTVTLPQ
jgi:hypothetical protein